MALPQFLDSPAIRTPRALPGRFPPLSDRESLDAFGTVAFGLDFIAGTVGIGHHSIEAGAWFALVPAVYRDDVVRGVEAVFREFEREPIRPGIIERFAAAMSGWIRENVTPR